VVTTSAAFSLVLILALLTSIVCYVARPRPRAAYIVALIIVFVALTYTHLVYSLIGLVLLTLFIVCHALSEFLSGNRRAKFIGMLAIVATLWTWHLVNATVFQTPLRALLRAITALTSLVDPNALAEVVSTSPTGSTTFQTYTVANLGFLFLLPLFLGGTLTLIDSKDHEQRAFGATAILFLVVTAISLVIGRELLLGSRNFFFLGIALASSAGLFVSRLIGLCHNRRARAAAVAGFIVLALVSSFVSVAGDRSNNLDPLIYEGQTPFLFFHTRGEKEIYSSLVPLLPNGSTVVTDFRSGSRGGLTLENPESITVIRFSDFSLPELNDPYDYVVLNMYSLQAGVLVVGRAPGAPIRYGLPVDIQLAVARLSTHNKIVDAGFVQLFGQSGVG